MTGPSQPRAVHALIAVGVLAVSTSAVLVKLSDAPPVALAFWRVTLAWLALLPFVVVREWDNVRTLPRRDVMWALLSGVFLAAHYAVWFLSLTLTSVASSTVLVTTQPIWVLLIAYVLWRERVAVRSLVGIAVALVGVYFIGAHALTQAGGQFLGDALAIVAAILVSGYLLIGQRIRPRVPLLVYVFFVYGAAAVVLGLFASMTEVPLTRYSPREWSLFAALAVIPTLFGHTVFNWALQYVSAAIVSVSVLGEPVGAVILALFLLGEVPAPIQIGAGVLILGGIGIFLRYRNDEAGAGRLKAETGGGPAIG